MENDTSNPIELPVDDESQQSAQPQEQLNTNAEASEAKKIGTFQEFVRSVGVALGLNSDEYLQFTQFMSDYHTGTGLFHVKSRIGKLLKGHPELVVQFNRFYREGDKQHMTPQKDSITFNESIEFVHKLKNEFMHDGRFWAFVRIMASYVNKQCNHDGVIREVCELFHDRIDVLLEFSTFIPS